MFVPLFKSLAPEKLKNQFKFNKLEAILKPLIRFCGLPQVDKQLVRRWRSNTAVGTWLGL